MILSLVDQYREPLDGLFQALADPTRRAVLARLAQGPASVTDLARPFAMALPSFMKHIHTLQAAGLVQTGKVGRVRTCALIPDAFAEAEGWLAGQRSLWEGRADRLDRLVTNIVNAGKPT
jgi:DNA-binding transcriptional ArsR family regulator